MSVLQWDKTGERVFENGVDQGVLYIPNAGGVYDSGHAWNGLVTVTESPSGAEATKTYADNRVYATLVSAEEYGASIEAYTYPDEWAQCDGSATPTPGVALGQQSRKSFGLSYRTKVGNDLDPDAGYKIHLVYGCTAAPSEKAHNTINDSPEATTFSYELTTTPVDVGTIGAVTYKPVSTITIDSTKEDPATMATLEEFLYGTAGTDPSLPTPAAVVAMFTAAVLTATPTEPTYNAATDTITIPSIAGVVYYIDGEVVAAGPVVISETTIVKAMPAVGYKFPPNTDDDWQIVYS